MGTAGTPFRFVRQAAQASRPGAPFRFVRQAAQTPRPGTPFRYTRAAPAPLVGSFLRTKQIDVGATLSVPSFTVSGLPSAFAQTGRIVFVSDEAGGAVLAFSDGLNWRRFTDRTVVS